VAYKYSTTLNQQITQVALNTNPKKSFQKFFKYYSLNFGPQHPSMYVTFRLILDLYEKAVTKADPHTDQLLHRSTEKSTELKVIVQGLPYLTRLNSSYVLAAAVVTQTVEAESFYDKHPLYTGLAIGTLLVVGGVLALCYWNVVPAVTVPLFSFLGLSDKVSARYIDPAAQKHFADLAKAALKDEQMSINTANNVTQVVNTANSVQSSVNLQNNVSQSSTSFTQSNSLDFNNSSVNSLGSQPNPAALPDTSSMSDSTLTSNFNLSDISSAMPSDVINPVVKATASAQEIAEPIMRLMADTAASGPTTEVATSIAINAAAAVAVKVLPLAIDTPSSPAVSPDALAAIPEATQDLSTLGTQMSSEFEFSVFHYIINMSPSNLSELGLGSVSPLALNTVQQVVNNPGDYSLWSTLTFVTAVMACAEFANSNFYAFLNENCKTVLLNYINALEKLLNSFKYVVDDFVENPNQYQLKVIEDIYMCFGNAVSVLREICIATKENFEKLQNLARGVLMDLRSVLAKKLNQS
jgi:hypothetical protein